MRPKIHWASPPLRIPLVAALAGVLGLVVFAPPSVLPRLDLAVVVHVLAAGMWAGGIMALASLRPPDGWGSAQARALIERFAPVALLAFAVTALTGVLQASEQLRDVSDLLTTTYGLVLVVKCAGVLSMLGLSLAWRAGRPVARLDAAAAILVVGATALLAAFPAQA
jgi:putative copper export protein